MFGGGNQTFYNQHALPTAPGEKDDNGTMFRAANAMVKEILICWK